MVEEEEEDEETF